MYLLNHLICCESFTKQNAIQLILHTLKYWAWLANKFLQSPVYKLHHSVWYSTRQARDSTHAAKSLHWPAHHIIYTKYLPFFRTNVLYVLSRCTSTMCPSDMDSIFHVYNTRLDLRCGSRVTLCSMAHAHKQWFAITGAPWTWTVCRTRLYMYMCLCTCTWEVCMCADLKK